MLTPPSAPLVVACLMLALALCLRLFCVSMSVSGSSCLWRGFATAAHSRQADIEAATTTATASRRQHRLRLREIQAVVVGIFWSCVVVFVALPQHNLRFTQTIVSIVSFRLDMKMCSLPALFDFESRLFHKLPVSFSIYLLVSFCIAQLSYLRRSSQFHWTIVKDM